MSKHIGLIGVGLLGQAIAERLLNAGFDVFGFDVRDDLEAFVGAGGKVCATVGDVAKHAQWIVLCLPDSQISQHVVAQLRPFLQAHTLIDTTTGAPDDAEALAGELQTLGVRYLDVTVAGSSEQMRNQAATLLVGSSEEDFQSCQDLFAVLGARVFYVGVVGSASRMKLVVNLAIGLNRAVLAEALAFGESLGFAPRQVAEVLRNTPAHSAAMDAKADKMVNGDFAPQARLRQHAKDVKLMIDLAEAHGARVPLLLLHERLLKNLIDRGYGDLDNSVVIEAFRNKD